MRSIHIISLFGSLLAGTVGCNLSANDLSAPMAQGGFGAGGSGNGTVITANGGSGGENTSVAMGGAGGGHAGVKDFAALCGKACVPKTAAATTCSSQEDGNAGNSGGAGGGGGAGPISGGVLDCYLVAEEDGQVAGQCSEAGSAMTGAPCLGSTDCAPGHGCSEGGVCRPYCCGDLEACPEASFCMPRRLAKSDYLGSMAQARVPFCVPTSPCKLLDDSTCKMDNETCTIVRNDGTTSCVEPGTSREFESCSAVSGPDSCAPGYLCSFASGTCHKICRTASPNCPSNTKCLGGSYSFPDGFGVCVPLGG